MRKWNKKLCGAVLMIMALIAGATFSGKSAFAAKKDVTNSIKDKEQIESLLGEFRDMTGYYSFYKLKKSGKITFDFSKDADRRIMLKYTYFAHENLGGKKQQKLSKQLFGKTVSKKVTQEVGDWGTLGPKLEIHKIIKTDAKKYQVKAVVYAVSEEDHKKTKKAEAVITLKKSSKAKYGYYVTKMELEK